MKRCLHVKYKPLFADPVSKLSFNSSLRLYLFKALSRLFKFSTIPLSKSGCNSQRPLHFPTKQSKLQFLPQVFSSFQLKSNLQAQDVKQILQFYKTNSSSFLRFSVFRVDLKSNRQVSLSDWKSDSLSLTLNPYVA